eukprot:scaffold242289_cov31-Tisochrysis_lutea.AAC.2
MHAHDVEDAACHQLDWCLDRQKRQQSAQAHAAERAQEIGAGREGRLRSRAGGGAPSGERYLELAHSLVLLVKRLERLEHALSSLHTFECTPARCARLATSAPVNAKRGRLLFLRLGCLLLLLDRRVKHGLYFCLAFFLKEDLLLRACPQPEAPVTGGGDKVGT